MGDPGSIPGLGEGNGNPLQYSCLENPMDGGAWQATVHGGGVTKSLTQLSDFTFKHSGLRTAPRTFCFGVVPWLCSLHQPSFVFYFSREKANLSFLEHLVHFVCIQPQNPEGRNPSVLCGQDTEEGEDRPCWSAENLLFFECSIFFNQFFL